MKFNLGLLVVLTIGCVSFSDADPLCNRQNPQNCYLSENLSWAGKNRVIENNKEPKGYLPLTAFEKQTGIVFCQYYHHKFDDSGSAKFRCARTNQDGVLYNDKGELVPEAKTVSTNEMGLTINLNGENIQVEEGHLLDQSGRLITKTDKKGQQKLVKADELKVKYFIDNDQTGGSASRRDVKLQLDANISVIINNTSENSKFISNIRWNEVFTEIASTRVFSALGLPADYMFPMKQVVCFGCSPHPFEQKNVDLKRNAIFNTVAIERRYLGKKISESVSINEINQKYYPQWSENIQHDYEALALGAALIGYFNASTSQNRMVCDKDSYNKAEDHCSKPIPMIQDVGSSWGGMVSKFAMLQYMGNPRGVLSVYKKGSVFSNAKERILKIPFGDKDELQTGLKQISPEGLRKFKERLKLLTPEVIQNIFEAARFDEMEPAQDSGFGDQATAYRERSASEKKKIIQEWSNALQKRINEILTAG